MSEQQNWAFRRCTPEDWSFVRELRIHPANVHGFVYRGPISEGQHAAYMAEHADNMYIGTVNEQPQGFVGITGPADSPEFILCVAPAFHGNGLGTYLLRKMLLRHPDLPARVLRTNQASLAVFHRLMVETETDERFVHFRGTKEHNIPFNRPVLRGGEWEAMQATVHDGAISGNKSFCKMAEKQLRALHDGAEILLTNSCTSALEMAALLLQLQPGDEVIVPSFTFVSSANAFASHGATIRFADVDPLTGCVIPSSVASRITERTRAVVAVHYAGRPCDITALIKLKADHDFVLIEDNAHGLGGSIDGRPLGTFGDLSTLSFHETKNITCGEGGALVLPNNSPFLEAAKMIRDKGTDRDAFIAGKTDAYRWQTHGGNFVLSDILAAFLTAQLRDLHLITEKRRALMASYRKELEAWANAKGVVLMPDHPSAAPHLFYGLFPDKSQRDHFLKHMGQCNILAVHHYLPLRESPFVKRQNWPLDDCPNATTFADRIVRWPLFNDMSETEFSAICRATKAW